jgi:hypothetical protein
MQREGRTAQKNHNKYCKVCENCHCKQLWKHNNGELYDEAQRRRPLKRSGKRRKTKWGRLHHWNEARYSQWQGHNLVAQETRARAGAAASLSAPEERVPDKKAEPGKTHSEKLTGRTETTQIVSKISVPLWPVTNASFRCLAAGEFILTPQINCRTGAEKIEIDLGSQPK